MNLQLIIQIKNGETGGMAGDGWLDYCREQPTDREHAQRLVDWCNKNHDGEFRGRLEDWDNPVPYDDVPVLYPTPAEPAPEQTAGRINLKDLYAGAPAGEFLWMISGEGKNAEIHGSIHLPDGRLAKGTSGWYRTTDPKTAAAHAIMAMDPEQVQR